jgi:8-oxo-dGTP pyrophosphatase MutT (NUDIX family)
MAPAPARESATVMLLRDGKDGIEVFMVVRHDGMAFAGGALVFPGGSVDATDHALAETLQTDGCDAVRIAALRETFEECGVLLAHTEAGKALVGAASLRRIEATWRRKLAQGEVRFADMVRDEQLRLAHDRLVLFAHWITPEAQPKRFDTKFFLAVAPADQLAVHDGHESVHSDWVTPQHAVSEAEAGRYRLVFATQMNLLKLARYASVADAMSAARRNPVVTVLPVQEHSAPDGTRQMRIPAEADYGGERFIIRLPSPSGR